MQTAAAREAELRLAAVVRLTPINLDDLVTSLGWQDRRWLAAATRNLLRPAARKFARQIVDFDTAVGREGIVGAARHALPHYVREVHVAGRENVPTGPFLALANHPGMSDALSLIGALDRSDLQIIALQRPFLEALPHVSQRLSCLGDKPGSPAAVLRKVGAHLRSGGAALSFPAGHIEPDPSASPGGAAESLKSWAPSAGLFARLAPGTAVLPVLVRGVVWPKVMQRWFAPPGSAATGDDKVAAALQLLAHLMLELTPVSVTVQIGRPVCLGEGTFDLHAIHQAVLAEMATMICHPPDAAGQACLALPGPGGAR